MSGNGERFDPQQYLRILRGKGGASAEYLDVKWRLVWLRQDHPEAFISTELIAGGIMEKFALFKASINIGNDDGYATAHGSETAADFGDFLEKAETKALGRALAMLGYGTQFVGFELDAAIVDAPVKTSPEPEPAAPAREDTRETRSAARSATKPESAADDAPAVDPRGVVPPELHARRQTIVAKAQHAGLNANEYADLKDYMESLTGKRSLRELSIEECNRVIAQLNADEAERIARLQAAAPTGEEAAASA